MHRHRATVIFHADKLAAAGLVRFQRAPGQVRYFSCEPGSGTR